ncbi:glycosyl hydrolase family 28 protein, partial [Klebsiella quasipneumoniae]|uniref:glycosyl hydrolase family 28 protein n=1 Tax=Klebsiella quasipneumoniae TaxID=1463165 RepID=UPI00358E2703
SFGWNGTYIVFQVVDANSFIVQGYVVPDDVNSAGAIKVARANKNITICGEGTVDYNYSGNNTAGGTNRICINLKHVFRPTVKGINILNAFKYACCISDAAHITEHDIYVDTNSDGLHHQGPIWGVDIRNISGNAGDDLVAFTGGDFAAYTQSIGDFNGIVIDGLYPTACYYAVKMTGNDDHRYRYVSVKNVGGVSKHGAIYAQ